MTQNENKKEDSLGDFGLEFELWIRNTLPWQLNLSDSKRVAMDIKFRKFADYIRPIASQKPEEFKRFFNKLKNNIKKISNWRLPKNADYNFRINKENKVEKYPDDRSRLSLIKSSGKKN